MKLSISNIGWIAEDDIEVYNLMKKYGYSGLEIAPTRIFPTAPYSDLDKAKKWSDELKRGFGFDIPSMQSIWFGRQESIFGTEEERKILVEYTKSAIDFAVAVQCKNLVFGCPRNRNMPEDADEQIAIDFFKEIGDYAYNCGTVIGMEANPPIYNTNYVNDTVSALQLIDKVDSKGFLLNLDVGTMIHNEESIEVLNEKVHLINHVHISEPGLKPVEERQLHMDLAEILKKENYKNYISIEMGKQEEISVVEEKLNYVKKVFG